MTALHDAPAFRVAGACAAADEPDNWFPTNRRSPEAYAAKRECSACPVRNDCLEYALLNDEVFGIWGGLDRDERVQLLRRPLRAAG